MVRLLWKRAHPWQPVVIVGKISNLEGWIFVAFIYEANLVLRRCPAFFFMREVRLNGGRCTLTCLLHRHCVDLLFDLISDGGHFSSSTENIFSQRIPRLCRTASAKALMAPELHKWISSMLLQLQNCFFWRVQQCDRWVFHGAFSFMCFQAFFGSFRFFIFAFLICLMFPCRFEFQNELAHTFGTSMILYWYYFSFYTTTTHLYFTFVDH